MSSSEWRPAGALELGRMLAENAKGAQSPLLPVGGRTALHYGGPVPAHSILVSTADLQKIVDYPARDMTITVEAGLRIDELQQVLAKEKQRLPIDIAQSHRATIGGAVAANTSGPGRYGYGTFRDYVIGISAVDGQGRLFSSGGRVVKNVAGYDLCKLLTGSHGTLGVITQLTLKLKPMVECRHLVVAATESIEQVTQALNLLNTSATRPVALDVLNPLAASNLRKETQYESPPGHYLLCLGYEGGSAECDWQTATAKTELSSIFKSQVDLFSGAAADQFWQSLTEFQIASDDPLTCQVSVLPSRTTQILEQTSKLGLAVQAHAGNGVLIGHLPDQYADAQSAAGLMRQLKTTVEAAGGSLQLLNCDPAWKTQMQAIATSPAELALHQRLKTAFDPANVLSPGRMWDSAPAPVLK
ncbi:FAD-binding oxidoreductase [Planctomicrobium sp. SH527]|uniref:FAD-binding oxidoreductase n=1 Tax=Planctomicrobium sp. SH527 TaxID=3448123 RepID=UPI003F5B14D7